MGVYDFKYISLTINESQKGREWSLGVLVHLPPRWGCIRRPPSGAQAAPWAIHANREVNPKTRKCSSSALGFWDKHTMARASTMPYHRDLFSDYQAFNLRRVISGCGCDVAWTCTCEHGFGTNQKVALSPYAGTARNSEQVESIYSVDCTSTFRTCMVLARVNHAKNKKAGRIIPFLVLGFWDNNTAICVGAMSYRRYFPVNTRI